MKEGTCANCGFTVIGWGSRKKGGALIHKLSSHMKCLVTRVNHQRCPCNQNTWYKVHELIFNLFVHGPVSWMKTNRIFLQNRRWQQLVPYSLTSIFMCFFWEERAKITVARCLYSSVYPCAERLLCNETPAIRNKNMLQNSSTFILSLPILYTSLLLHLCSICL